MQFTHITEHEVYIFSVLKLVLYVLLEEEADSSTLLMAHRLSAPAGEHEKEQGLKASHTHSLVF